MIVVVPMAGRGTRLASRSADIPKPLIDVSGRPMLAWAVESLAAIDYSRIVFVALADHSSRYDLPNLVHTIAGSRASVIEIDHVTEGQLCTVIAARNAIDAGEDLLVASADTFVESDLASDIADRTDECRGLISVARLAGDHWSFAAVDETGWVTAVAEKNRISPLASTGLYYFSSGREFLETADDIIQRKETTRGEYYVIQVYKAYLERRWRVGVSEAREAWDMGTPEALSNFECWLETRGK
jgi:NDP-sugar pyrophosphorylase family protein